MKSGIYKIENLITGDIYVGSSANLKNRYSRHLSDLIKNKHHSIILQRAFNKYGADNFSFILLENCAIENLIPLEQKYFDLLKPIYNILQVAGSSIGHIVTEETKIKHRKYAAENNVKPPECTWRDKQKEVLMLNKDTLEILQRFESLASACRNIGKNISFVSTLSSCCENKRFSAFGYRWVYSIDDIKSLRFKKPLIAWNKGLKIDNNKSKKVKQYNMNHEYITEFNSVKDAERIFGKGISNCALGKSKSSNGYIWKY